MNEISTKAAAVATDSWAARAYKVLDEENRGFIYASEILNHISFAGVMKHHKI